MALAARFNLKMTQFDVETAYLNGKTDAEIFMETPELLQEMLDRIIVEEGSSNISRRARIMLKILEKSDTVCRLNKALYGLRQAGRQWNAELDKRLKIISLSPTHADPCVYVDREDMTFIIVYVDDILIVSNNRKRESEIKEKLSECFKIKDLGEARYCLEFEIRRKGESLHLSQKEYIKEVLKRFEMHDSKPVNTPLVVDAKLIKGLNVTDLNDKSLPFRELVGSLMYAAVGTRPDIAHAVSVLSQFNSCYTRTHWMAAKRVLRYLRGTSDFELVYKKDDLSINAFVDADWGRCILDRRSYTGFVFTLNGTAISWLSQKQRTVALSSMEAEYMAISDAAKEALYLINFLKELRCSGLASVTMYNDNRSAGLLSHNPVQNSRSKHIDLRHHFIRDVLKDHPVKLIYMPTEEMIADALTKALPEAKLLKCALGFGLELDECHGALFEGEC